MPGFQLLMKPCDRVLLYDGSLAGLYTCVHACIYGKQLPFAILPEAEPQCSLLPPCRIATDMEKATRVREAIRQKISTRALELCEHVFLSAMPSKEMAVLHFAILGFRMGAKTPNMLTHPQVAPLLAAEKHLLGEAHLLLGFVRFADQDGKLVAAIRPKNFVLPLLAPHFADRYAQETFLIVDRTYQVALAYCQGRSELVEAAEGLVTCPSEEEQYYRGLWKRFYQTIAIQERINHRCRRSHMPKRYWEHILEVQPGGEWGSRASEREHLV